MQTHSMGNESEMAAVPSSWWVTDYHDVNWSHPEIAKKRVAPIIRRMPSYHVHSPIPNTHPMLRFSSTRQENLTGESSKPGPTNSRSRFDIKEDGSLNPRLVGVKVAEAAVEIYERDAGFYYSVMPDLNLTVKTQPQNISTPINEEDVDSGKSRWAEMVKEFLGTDWHESLVNSIARHRPRSSTSSEYDSERSTDSDPLPPTPTQTQRDPSHIVIHQISPTSPIVGSRGVTSSKASSSSSTSFTPISANPPKSLSLLTSSDSNAPSPTLANFTFPSINANYQYLPPSLKKDDQGFYTAVTPPGTPWKLPTRAAPAPSSALLPPFLSDLTPRNRKVSKTREIVDQLRSASAVERENTVAKGRSRIRPRSAASEHDRALHSSTPGDAEGRGDNCDNAQINTIQEDAVDAKARRTQELVQALNRPRPSSFDIMSTNEKSSDTSISTADSLISKQNHGKSLWNLGTQSVTHVPTKKTRTGGHHTRNSSSVSSTSSAPSHSLNPPMQLPSSKPFPLVPFQTPSVPYTMQYHSYTTPRPATFFPMYTSMYPLSYGAPTPAAFQRPPVQMGPSQGTWAAGYSYPPPAAPASF